MKGNFKSSNSRKLFLEKKSVYQKMLGLVAIYKKMYNLKSFEISMKNFREANFKKLK